MSTNESRRDFLKDSAAAGATLALLGAAGIAAAQDKGGDRRDIPMALLSSLVPGAVDDAGTYVLPKLAYAYDALEAAIDARTMELHHTKHHNAYVTGANKALSELAKMRESGDFALVEHWSRKLSFNAGGHVLHCIFWDCLGPKPAAQAEGALSKAIARDFGSQEAMWKQFAAAAKAVEGSGWARLSWDLASGKLTIMQGLNQNLLTNFAEVPLLVLDVWEHAYYLRYANDRGAYVDAVAKIIDWAKISARFERLQKLAVG